MKKYFLIILMLIIAFLLAAGCTGNTDGGLSEESSGQPASPSAALSAPVGPDNSDSYYTVEKNGRQGVVNGNGQVVLPFEYSKIDILYCGEAPAAFFAAPAYVRTGGQKPSGYFGSFSDGFLYDLNGSLIYKDKINYAYPICDSLIQLYNNEKCGVISYEGGEIIPFKYNSISLCGRYIVAVAGDFHNVPDKTSDVDVYDKSGKLQNSGKLRFVGAYDSLIMVADDTGAKFGLVDIRLKEAVPAEWDELNSAGSGLYIARRGEKYGVIDGSGKEIVPVRYNYADLCCDSADPASMIFTASDKNGVYVFDQDGNQLFSSNKYNYVFIQNGVMIARDQWNMSHYINQEGEDVIPPAESMSAVASGLILCYGSGEDTCYTKEGVKLPLPETDSIGVVSPERFIFTTKRDGLYGVFDEGGNIIVPPKYTYLYPCYDKNDLAVFTAADKPGETRYGVIDIRDGSTLFEGFDWLTYAGGGLFYATKGTVRGLVNAGGSFIWQTSDYQTLMD